MQRFGLILFSILILIGGVLIILSNQKNKVDLDSDLENNVVTENSKIEFSNQKSENIIPVTIEKIDNGKSVVSKTYEIIYTDEGYVPSNLTIKKGETIIFKNQNKEDMWVGSAMHPDHIVYSGTSLEEHCPDLINTSFDACKGYPTGTSWSFTFDKIGTWGYHDHLTPKFWGKITVE